MPWIYLSPHFDDAALSCGGLVWEQAKQNEMVSIWTVCAGEPPSSELSPFARELHDRWELDHNAPAQRRIEDQNSCQRLGASSRYFSTPDCIYRRNPASGEYLYASEAALNSALQAGDGQVIQSLQVELKQCLDPSAELVSPLGLGNHVDHQLARRAAEGLDRPLWYFADFPYVLRNTTFGEQLEREGWSSRLFPITEDGLAAWVDSISAHASQVSTFWANDLAMRQVVADYLNSSGGIRLWRKPGA